MRRNKQSICQCAYISICRLASFDINPLASQLTAQSGRRKREKGNLFAGRGILEAHPDVLAEDMIRVPVIPQGRARWTGPEQIIGRGKGKGKDGPDKPAYTRRVRLRESGRNDFW